MALDITHLHIAMRFEPHGASITQGDEQVLVAWPAARLDACRHEFFALRPWQDEDDGDNKPLLDTDLHLVFPASRITRRRRMAVDHRLQTEIWLASRALCVATESNLTGFGKQRDAAKHSDHQFAPEPTL